MAGYSKFHLSWRARDPELFGLNKKIIWYYCMIIFRCEYFLFWGESFLLSAFFVNFYCFVMRITL